VWNLRGESRAINLNPAIQLHNTSKRSTWYGF
jgi:hypothetical protein